MNIIETEGLTKRYGKLTAAGEVCLSVRKGEIYGFLGLNGAGKTTTIRMLLGMIRPDAGKVMIGGQRIMPGKQGPWNRVGYLVELPYSYPELTVMENLMAVSRLRGLDGSSHAEEQIRSLRLGAYAGVPARNLSLGNNQRLGLAKALLHNPDILILDEPTNALDPSGIVEIRELLKTLSGRGVTIFISSHNLGEIARIAGRIGIIHRGSMVQEINAGELETRLDRTLVLDTRDRHGALNFLIEKGFQAEWAPDSRIRVPGLDAGGKPEEINSLLVRAGFPPLYLNAEKEDLETYFLRMIGEIK